MPPSYNTLRKVTLQVNQYLFRDGHIQDLVKNDDILHFSLVQNKNGLSSQLNNDLGQVIEWTYTWNVSFNEDPSKQAQEMIFFKKV